jgi:hypothetical protein
MKDKTRAFFYALAVSISILFALFIYGYYFQFLGFEGGVVQPGGGGSCPIYKLYDKEGRGYDNEFSQVDYFGSAPLYWVEESQLPLPPDPNCPECCKLYPDRIDAKIARSGTPVYPLSLSVNMPDHRSEFLQGGSFALAARLEIGDRFDENSTWTDATQPLYYKLRLDSPNFTVAPTNEDTESIKVGMGMPGEMHWILSPKANAMGEQVILISASGKENPSDPYGLVNYMEYEIRVNIDERSIITTAVTSLFSAVGGFIVVFLTILNQGMDVFKRILMRKRKAKHHKSK